MSSYAELLGGLDRDRPVVIQAHDFPDHDAVGASYALAHLLREDGVDVKLSYGGTIQSASLSEEIETLRIPIGAASEVKNSIVMNGTNVPHHNYVGDSVLGENCNLGSGCKVANLRLDEGNIRAIVKGQLVDSGRRKLGVIMGENVKTGINSIINTGTIISEDAFLGPGATAHGFITPGSKIL